MGPALTLGDAAGLLDSNAAIDAALAQGSLTGQFTETKGGDKGVDKGAAPALSAAEVVVAARGLVIVERTDPPLPKPFEHTERTEQVEEVEQVKQVKQVEPVKHLEPVANATRGGSACPPFTLSFASSRHRDDMDGSRGGAVPLGRKSRGAKVAKGQSLIGRSKGAKGPKGPKGRGEVGRAAGPAEARSGSRSGSRDGARGSVRSGGDKGGSTPEETKEVGGKSPHSKGILTTAAAKSWWAERGQQKDVGGGVPSPRDVRNTSPAGHTSNTSDTAPSVPSILPSAVPVSAGPTETSVAGSAAAAPPHTVAGSHVYDVDSDDYDEDAPPLPPSPLSTFANVWAAEAAWCTRRTAIVLLESPQVPKVLDPARASYPQEWVDRTKVLKRQVNQYIREAGVALGVQSVGYVRVCVCVCVCRFDYAVQAIRLVRALLLFVSPTCPSANTIPSPHTLSLSTDHII